MLLLLQDLFVLSFCFMTPPLLMPKLRSNLAMPCKEGHASSIKLAMVAPGQQKVQVRSWEQSWLQLVDWAEKEKIKWSGFKVDDVGGYRGAIATRSLKEEDVIVVSPRESTLLVQEHDECPFPPDFLDPQYWDEIHEYWNLRMALRLIYEKRRGEESKWYQYIQILPTNFDVPLLFSQDELKELQDPLFIHEVEIEQKYFEYERRRMADFMPLPPSKEELGWALACAGSRTFTADFGDGRPVGQCMCPIADMVNHEDEAEPAFRWNPEEECFELFAPRSRQRGEEICISYGDVNGKHLLHYYGFLPFKNKHEHFVVTEDEILETVKETLGEEDETKLKDVKQHALKLLVNEQVSSMKLPLAHLEETSLLLDDTRQSGHEFRVPPSSSPLLPDLRIFLNLLAVDSQEAKVGALQLARLLQDGDFLSPSHRSRSLKIFRRVIEKKMSAMATTMEEDEEILKQTETSQDKERLRLCVRYRLSLKQMLQNSLSFVQD